MIIQFNDLLGEARAIGILNNIYRGHLDLDLIKIRNDGSLYNISSDIWDTLIYMAIPFDNIIE